MVHTAHLKKAKLPGVLTLVGVSCCPLRRSELDPATNQDYFSLTFIDLSLSADWVEDHMFEIGLAAGQSFNAIMSEPMSSVVSLFKPHCQVGTKYFWVFFKA